MTRSDRQGRQEQGGTVKRDVLSWSTSRVAMAAATMVLGWTAAAQAAVPTTTLVEGALAAASGQPVADGAYAFTFSLYKSPVDVNPVWTEGPIQVSVKQGQMTYLLGTTVALGADTLAQAGFLGIRVGDDPELPRSPLASAPFALRASAADGLACSGCLPLTSFVEAEVGAYAKAADLAAFATSGKRSDLAGAPDFDAYAISSKLAKVAQSGSLMDVAGKPDVSGFAEVANLNAYAKSDTVAEYAKTADLAKAATTGSYLDVSGAPTLLGLGVACGTGLVVRAIKDDGTLVCIAGAATELKPDDLTVVSNGLLTNVFTDTFASAGAKAIPDNNPTGVGDEIVVGDVGIAQKLTLTAKITNSDISTVTVIVYDPANAAYKLWDKSGTKGAAIDTTWPSPTKTVTGDLTTWHGKNPKGSWRILVIDGQFLNNTSDGQIVSWSVNLTTMSNKKINVKGDLIVTGTLALAGASPVPSGVIMPFSAASCPTAWSPADGNANRPNLLGRFPIGVGNLPQGGSVTLRQTGGSHMWRLYGAGPGRGCRTCYNYDLSNTGWGWQGETDVTVGNGTSWTGYSNHLPPYTGVLWCVKD